MWCVRLAVSALPEPASVPLAPVSGKQAISPTGPTLPNVIVTGERQLIGVELACNARRLDFALGARGTIRRAATLGVARTNDLVPSRDSFG